jgi:hypothetical protein
MCPPAARSLSQRGWQNWRRLRAPKSSGPLFGCSRATSPTSNRLAKACSNNRIDFGPGYRVYFGRDGEALVILLTGGTKKRQQRDIDTAHAYWRDYKQSKRGQR